MAVLVGAGQEGFSFGCMTRRGLYQLGAPQWFLKARTPFACYGCNY